MPAAPATRSGRPSYCQWTALVISVVLALVVWATTFNQIGGTISSAWESPVVTADVLSCGDVPIGPGCTVRYLDAAGTPVTRPIDRPGLVGAETGDRLPLWVASDGTVSPAGWRPWTDALILLSLTAFTTWAALGRVTRVIGLGDQVTVFDLEGDLGGAGRLRDVG